MPRLNRFRHQRYTSGPPAASYELVAATPPAAPGSDEFARRMARVGDAMREAAVESIYLVHGTFVGGDALGILSEVGRWLPGTGRSAHDALKGLVDRLAGDAANYTAHYAEVFEKAINRPGAREIPVRRFHWSGENHHLGRADGAVGLFGELARARVSPHGRVLLWGHSHAGNVFALLTNLLAGARDALNRFFDAAEVYYRVPGFGRIDRPGWQGARETLAGGPGWIGRPKIDLVTFGTPVRYGWESGGYENLLHFVYHRPLSGLPDYLAAFPPTADELLSMPRGDYVQQLGIAGTNILPGLLTPRTMLADLRLATVVQAGIFGNETLENLRRGCIVPDEGTTLLADYGLPDGGLVEHLAGHAVYTRLDRLLFHAEETVRRFYGLPGP